MSHGQVPKPCTTFEHASFPEYVMQEIRKAGYVSPTGIQVQGWPIALSGRIVGGLSGITEVVVLCIRGGGTAG